MSILRADRHFDLQGRTLTFRPSQLGGYGVEIGTLQFIEFSGPRAHPAFASSVVQLSPTQMPESVCSHAKPCNGGTKASLTGPGEGCSESLCSSATRGGSLPPVRLPFVFPFGGRSFSAVYPSPNGTLLFGTPEAAVWTQRDPWPAGSMLSLASALDARAAAGAELSIAVCAGLYDAVKSTMSVALSQVGAVVTWEATRAVSPAFGYAPRGPSIFQAVLHVDGSIQLSFKSIGELDGIVGVFDGAAPLRGNLSSMSVALSPALSPAASQALGQGASQLPGVESSSVSDRGSVLCFAIVLDGTPPASSGVEGFYIEYRVHLLRKGTNTRAMFGWRIDSTGRQPLAVDVAVAPPHVIGAALRNNTIELYYSKLNLDEDSGRFGWALEVVKGAPGHAPAVTRWPESQRDFAPALVTPLGEFELAGQTDFIKRRRGSGIFGPPSRSIRHQLGSASPGGAFGNLAAGLGAGSGGAGGGASVDKHRRAWIAASSSEMDIVSMASAMHAQAVMPPPQPPGSPARGGNPSTPNRKTNLLMSPPTSPRKGSSISSSSPAALLGASSSQAFLPSAPGTPGMTRVPSVPDFALGAFQKLQNASLGNLTNGERGGDDDTDDEDDDTRFGSFGGSTVSVAKSLPGDEEADQWTAGTSVFSASSAAAAAATSQVSGDVKKKKGKRGRPRKPEHERKDYAKKMKKAAAAAAQAQAQAAQAQSLAHAQAQARASQHLPGMPPFSPTGAGAGLPPLGSPNFHASASAAQAQAQAQAYSSHMSPSSNPSSGQSPFMSHFPSYSVPLFPPGTPGSPAPFVGIHGVHGMGAGSPMMGSPQGMMGGGMMGGPQGHGGNNGANGPGGSSSGASLLPVPSIHSPLVLDKDTLQVITIDDFEAYYEAVRKLRSITPAESKDVQRQRRLLKNRQSAQTSRQKRKQYIEELEGKLARIRAANGLLRNEIAGIRAQSNAVASELAGGPPAPASPLPMQMSAPGMTQAALLQMQQPSGVQGALNMAQSPAPGQPPPQLVATPVRGSGFDASTVAGAQPIASPASTGHVYPLHGTAETAAAAAASTAVPPAPVGGQLGPPKPDGGEDSGSSDPRFRRDSMDFSDGGGAYLPSLLMYNSNMHNSDVESSADDSSTGMTSEAMFAAASSAFNGHMMLDGTTSMPPPPRHSGEAGRAPVAVPVGVNISGGVKPIFLGTTRGQVFEVFHYPVAPKSVAQMCRQVFSQPSIDPNEADFAVFFSDFRVDDLYGHGGCTNTRAQSIRGLGIDPEAGDLAVCDPDVVARFGSSRLQAAPSVVYIGQPRFSATVEDQVHGLQFNNYALAVGWIAHELGHRFGSFLRLREPSSGEVMSLASRDLCHWNKVLHAPSMHEVSKHFCTTTYPETSPMGGSLLTAAGPADRDGKIPYSLTRSPYLAPCGFSSLDMYCWGLLDPSEVKDVFMLRDSERVPPAEGGPKQETVIGRSVPVRAWDIVSAMGPRVPDVKSSQKSYRLVLYLLMEPGRSTPTDTGISRAHGIAQAVSKYFSEATAGRLHVEAVVRHVPTKVHASARDPAQGAASAAANATAAAAAASSAATSAATAAHMATTAA